MLNELRELAVSLEKAGICPPDFHPKFTLCPKKTAFCVWLSHDGNISSLTPIPIEDVQKIRKWEGVGSNGTSFPAFSVLPLLRVTDEEDCRKISSMKRGLGASHDEVTNIAAKAENLWNDRLGKKTNIFDKVKSCLDKPVKDLITRLSNPPEELSSISLILDSASKIELDKLYDQLKTLLIKLAASGDKKAIDALFFCGVAVPAATNDFQLIFETTDWKHYPANHNMVQSWINTRLLDTGSSEKSDELDAFGISASGKDSLFPSVRVPILGDVTLRAMNKESPCQTRYAMKEFASFPAGEDVRKKMKSSLEWLSSIERKGKTWSDLSKRVERSMILFAYPSILPEKIPDLAGMLGDADETNDDSSETFTTLAGKVTAAFHGGTNDTMECDVRVFVLGKMDKARTKVMASSRYTAKHVIQSAEKWQEGCRAIPEIEIRCFGKNKGDKPTWQKPLIPFPAEVVWCLNTVWMAGKDDKGERISRAKSGHGFTVNDSLCLLLDDGIELNQVANRALGAVIRNSSSLLQALGNAHAMGKVHKTDNKKYTKQLLLLPSIIVLLLYKLGHTKGEFMASPAFLVGRLFNIADSLHLEYCKQVRNNSIPPQLVGNALMATAQEEPVKALSVLWGRIKPYHAWAQTLKDGEHVGLVRYFLKHLGEVSDQLKDLELPTRCTDADKAQMLLGYLAKLESNN